MIPTIKTDSSLIRDEVNALRLFNTKVQNIFPKVLYFNQESNLILLSDVGYVDSTLEYKFNYERLERDDLKLLGKEISRIHFLTGKITEQIRKEGDKDFRERQLEYLFGFLNHPALNSVVNNYKSMPTNLVIGDPSPKNMYVGRNKVGICDLEHAHQGWTILEQAHLIAHIGVHSLGGDIGCNIREFISGYGITRDDLLVQSVIGVMLYRLVNPIIPYSLTIGKTRRGKVAKTLIGMLNKRNLGFDNLLLVLEQV